jgi:hypothetical protein
VQVARCGWQSGRSGGLNSSPYPSSLLSGGGEVHGVDDKSTTAMSGSGGVVVGLGGLTGLEVRRFGTW